MIEAGPSFVKIGQSLSTRPDLLGIKLAKDLSILRDQIPAFSGQQAKQVIEKEMGKNIDQVFLSFDDVPIAAASVAQVHYAVSLEKQKVAVKVLRPNISNAFQSNINLLYWVANLAERVKPNLRRFKLRKVIKVIEDTVNLEMDLRLEAAAAAELANNFIEYNDFIVPKINWNLTTQRMMTTERLVGIPIDDRDAIIRAGLCPKAILRKLTDIACKQVFDHGFFHADAHPGNIFVTKSGSIGAVDFGIMGRLNGKTRHYLANILMAFLNRDYALAAELHFSANWVSKEHSVAQFAQACRAIAEPIMDRSLQNISVARLLAQLFKISKMFDMETQTQLILLQKTLIVAEGAARQLDPNTNSWSLIRPFMENWVWKESNEGISINKTLDNIYEIVENLPKLVENLKENSVCTKSQSVKLDPDTIQTIKGEEKFSSSLPITSTIIGLLILAYLSIH